MKTQNNYLSNQNLFNSFQALMTSMVSIQAISNGLANQPVLNLTNTSNLSNLQLETNTQASYFLNQVLDIQSTFASSIKEFYNSFLNHLPQFLKLANHLTTTPESSRILKEITFGLEILERPISMTKEKRENQVIHLAAFIDSIKKLVNQFDEVQKEASVKLQNGEIVSLKNQIAAIQNNIKKDNDIIAKGATNDILPIFEAVLAAFSSANSKNPQLRKRNAEIINASIKKVNKENEAEQQAREDVNKQLEHYNQLLISLDVDQFEFSLITTLYEQLHSFQTQLENLLAQVKAQNSSWSELNESIDHYRRVIKKSGTSDSLIPQIEQAKTFWKTFQIEVIKYTEIGKIPLDKINSN